MPPAYTVAVIETEKPTIDVATSKSKGRRKANGTASRAGNAIEAQTEVAGVEKESMVAVESQQRATAPKARPRAKPVPHRSQASTRSAGRAEGAPIAGNPTAPPALNDVDALALPSPSNANNPQLHPLVPGSGGPAAPMVFGGHDIPIDPILLGLEMATPTPMSFFGDPSVPSLNGYPLTGAGNTAPPPALPPPAHLASQPTTDLSQAPAGVIQPIQTTVPHATTGIIATPTFDEAYAAAPEWVKSKYDELYALEIDDPEVAATWASTLQTWTVLEFVLGYTAKKVCALHIFYMCS